MLVNFMNFYSLKILKTHRKGVRRPQSTAVENIAHTKNMYLLGWSMLSARETVDNKPYSTTTLIGTYRVP